MEDINDRIKYFREKILGIDSQKEFAEKIDVSPANLSQIESKSQKPSNSFIEKLLGAYPNINMNWLQKGKGPIYENKTNLMGNFHSDELERETVKGVTYLKMGDKRVMVELPYIRMIATASILDVYNDNNWTDIQEVMWIPYVDGIQYKDTIITDSNGDSMEPTIKSGSIIVAQKVDPSDWEYTTGICMVIVNNMRVIKRIKENTLHESETLKLHSDNPNHGAITVKKKDIHSIYRISLSVNKL
ncbi:MAG: LexA family transcriptional regulator [Raineya sp.]|jgi:phage repressor protein C with HTH and peptisase S24 domain|nr:LexA family transcriptional regulator [Raineya sp.]